MIGKIADFKPGGERNLYIGASDYLNDCSTKCSFDVKAVVS